MTTYTGDEAAVTFTSESPCEPDSVFDLRPPRVPKAAVAILDDDTGAVIGYREERMSGMYQIYDLNGIVIGMGEKPLETPTVDPIDLIFLVGGVFRTLGKGLFVNGTTRMAPRIAAGTAAVWSIRAVSSSMVGAMRAVFRGLAVRNLKFTATTAARMATKGRHVPMHILHLALKYGTRVPDPQGVKGAFLYTVKMLRNGTEYTLEIVVREKDWTILHFLYR